ncbi:hypothetical protein LAZ67_5003634 [Cordylochernes scorpioides]|uniref:C2H2-type domain-containing protein n=1 Tax=Cordylochernes scorpioides TaxID=51811 RepID=A0ABY6KI27_9ARAC|nr:hypothetical protein LAZ67_5003634 [Cordylochernes scorpioides]
MLQRGINPNYCRYRQCHYEEYVKAEKNNRLLQAKPTTSWFLVKIQDNNKLVLGERPTTSWFLVKSQDNNKLVLGERPTTSWFLVKGQANNKLVLGEKPRQQQEPPDLPACSSTSLQLTPPTMQNGTYSWVSSSSLTQKSWQPGYQASLSNLYFKNKAIPFHSGISQLAAATSYIEKISTLNDHVQKCPHPDAKDKPYPCDICTQYISLCNTLRTDCASGSGGNRPSASPVGMPNSSHELKPLSLVPSSNPADRLQLIPVSSSQNALQRTQRLTANKTFACHLCHKFFTQKGNLKTHMMIHTGEKPYACQMCGKCFTQKGNVDTHMKIHTGEKEFGCDRCTKRFTQKGNLKTHVRSVHTKEKPFACDICSKAFSQKGNMMTHMRTHNKDDRFPCNLCGKTFSQKGNLKTHMQRHTGQLPQRKAYGRGPLNRIPGVARHNPDSLAHMSPFALQHSPPISQSSAIPLLSSSSKYDKSPLTPDFGRSGLSLALQDSDCKPCLNSPISPATVGMMSNSMQRHSPSPSPLSEQHKLLQNSHLAKQMPPGEMMSSHGLALHTGAGGMARSSPMACPSDPEPRSFYSAPSTPLSHSSRWLPPRHYDSFQTHHPNLSSYNISHPTPLSRLSLFANSGGAMPPPHPSLDKQQDSPDKPTHTIHHEPQFHHGPTSNGNGGNGNPDFTQLLE